MIGLACHSRHCFCYLPINYLQHSINFTVSSVNLGFAYFSYWIAGSASSLAASLIAEQAKFIICFSLVICCLQFIIAKLLNASWSLMARPDFLQICFWTVYRSKIEIKIQNSKISKEFKTYFDVFLIAWWKISHMSLVNLFTHYAWTHSWLIRIFINWTVIVSWFGFIDTLVIDHIHINGILVLLILTIILNLTIISLVYCIAFVL